MATDTGLETFVALQEKHLAPHPQTSFPPPPDSTIDPVVATTEMILSAIKTFANGSAGRPDGLGPQHLKDLTGPSANEGSQLLLTSLTSFTNLLLNTPTPSSIGPSFLGAYLTALKKKDGGIRPIAVGCTLRRLVAKVACNMVRPDVSAFLAPCQLGFGVRGGMEAAFHAARCYVHHLPPGYTVVKLDLRTLLIRYVGIGY